MEAFRDTKCHVSPLNLSFLQKVGRPPACQPPGLRPAPLPTQGSGHKETPQEIRDPACLVNRCEIKFISPRGVGQSSVVKRILSVCKVLGSLPSTSSKMKKSVYPPSRNGYHKSRTEQ